MTYNLSLGWYSPCKWKKSEHDLRGRIPLKKNILLVEDSTFLKRSLVRTLEYAEFHVTAVSDGRQGLERLQANRHNGQAYHVLVTDILMPIMSGTELIRAISIAGISIPVLVITNLRSTQRTELQDFSPKLRVLEKPFNPDQLVDAVTNLILSE